MIGRKKHSFLKKSGPQIMIFIRKQYVNLCFRKVELRILNSVIIELARIAVEIHDTAAIGTHQQTPLFIKKQTFNRQHYTRIAVRHRYKLPVYLVESEKSTCERFSSLLLLIVCLCVVIIAF